MRELKSATPAFRLAPGKGRLQPLVFPREGGGESYGLEVRPREIVCQAKQPAGLFYGLQTLCQLIRANRRG